MILLALAAPAPARSPAAPPTGTLSLAPDAETRWVPFVLTPGNQISLPVRLDGRDVVAVLDTGVSHSVLSRDHPGINRRRVRPGGTATAIGGQVAVEWLPIASLTLGGLTRHGGGVTLAALPALATGGGARGVDLLIGRDLLAEHALDIDYAARRLRILPSGRLPFRGENAPLAVSARRLVFESELVLGDRRLRPMVVDTGDGAAITLSLPAWQSVRPPGLPTTTAIAYGLGGPVISTMAVVPGVRIGDVAARDVEVRVEPAGGFSERIGAAGRIGSGFLQHYRVLLDLRARRMVLAPGPHAGGPALRSTSGLLVGVARDRLRVLHVMRDGPAARDGWREGEEICAVDGQPIAGDYLTGPLASWSIGAPGRVVRLALCGGAERTLTLASFY